MYTLFWYWVKPEGLNPISRKKYLISNLIICFRFPRACVRQYTVRAPVYSACNSTLECVQHYVRVRAMEYFTGIPISICKFFYNEYVTYIWILFATFWWGGGGEGGGGVPSRANNRKLPKISAERFFQMLARMFVKCLLELFVFFWMFFRTFLKSICENIKFLPESFKEAR